MNNLNSLKNTQLDMAYKILFKKRVENEFYSKNLGLALFINHLERLRDMMLLKNQADLEQNTNKTVLATLSTAIAEANAYLNSNIEEQKTFHWNNFCDFLKFNMEEWLTFNDSV